MPPVVAAVAVALAISEAMAVYVIVMGVVMLASVAYSAYMMASMEAPKQPDAMTRNQTVRSSVQPHRMIYGECLTGGALVYAQSHDSLDYDGLPVPNGYITLVVAFTGHEVEEISEIWFNDKISTDGQFTKYIPYQPEQGYWQIDASNPEGVWVVTRPAIDAHTETFAKIEKYLGTPDQEASTLLCSLTPKPTNLISQVPESGLDDLTVYDFRAGYGGYYGTYTGQGMCIFTITITATGDNDTFDWKQQKYLEDGTTLTETASGTLTMNGMVQDLTDGVKIAFGSINHENSFIFSTTGHSIGQTWEIRAFDGAPWTPAHRLQGRSYVVVTLENSNTAFPNGLPNIRARIKGNNQIYDPRTGTTGYTDNWALCVRDYLTKPYGIGATDDEINAASAIAAANISDELVATKEGGYVRQRGRIVMDNVTYQKRYTLNGSFTVDKTPTAIMSEILATAYGAITWTQGQYRILPAAYYPPDPDFCGMNPNVPGLTESDLRGPIKVRPRTSMKDRFNAVKGTYISPETWQPVDFPIVRNALYKAEDGGEEIARDIQLTYITDSRMAQRVAKIMLEKSRQGITVDFPAKWSAFPLAVGDNVPITIAQLGWDQKIFTVKDWKLNPEGGVDLQLQEEAEGCYAWDSGEETTHDIAPDTLLPDPRYVPTPTGLAVGEELYRGNVASVVKSRAILTWTSNGARQYEINYLPPNNTIWAPLPTTTETTCLIDDTAPGPYSFRVRGVNYLGAWSEWAMITATLLGKSAPPPPVDSFTINRLPNGMRRFAWTMLAPPLDMAGFRIRYSQGDSVPWEQMSPLHEGLLVSSPYETNQLAAGAFEIAIAGEDTTGNQSTPVFVSVELSAPFYENLLLLEQPALMGWPGTWLYSTDDPTTWATAPATWDEWTAWGVGKLHLQYTHTVIDLGTPATFHPFIEVSGTGSMTVEIRTSADAVTWSEWAAPAGASISTRYLQVRVTATSDSPEITALNIYLDGIQIVQDINDLNTATLTGANRIAAGDIRLPLSDTVSAIKQVQVALQGVGPGWTWVLADKNTSPGPRIKIYNASGVLSDALIDATIKSI